MCSRSYTSKKVRSIRVLGLLYLGHLHRPFHIWEDNPLLDKYKIGFVGSFTRVNKSKKNSPGSSKDSLAHSPSSLHPCLSIALLLSRQTPPNLNVVAPEATG